MRKDQKLKKMIGAIVGFKADTPESNVGELTQFVVLKVEKVYKAKKNGEMYVLGLALKRMSTPTDKPVRQYAINRIHNKTLVVLSNNKWTKKNIKPKKHLTVKSFL